MKIEEILKQAAKIVRSEIKGNYQLFLFGSRAREIYYEKSDIDKDLYQRI